MAHRLLSGTRWLRFALIIFWVGRWEERRSFIFYFPTDSIWNRVYGFDRAKLFGSSPFSSVENKTKCVARYWIDPLIVLDAGPSPPPFPFCDHFDVARSFYTRFPSFLFSILSSAALSKRLLLWSVSPDRKKNKNKKLGLEIKRSKKGARLLIESERKRNKRKAIGHVRVTSQNVGRTRSSIFENSSPPPYHHHHTKKVFSYIVLLLLLYISFIPFPRSTIFGEYSEKRWLSPNIFWRHLYTHPKRPAARQRERERKV